MKKRVLAATLATVMGLSIVPAFGTTVFAEEKPTVTLMIDIAGFTPLNNAVKMIEEKFPEYNIVSKQWAYDDLRKVIKTTFAGEENIDISFCDVSILQSFADADMLLDLTKYLEEDAEWKAGFVESALGVANMNGKQVGVPWQMAYPVFIANNDVWAEVGLTPEDDWKFDDWMEAGQTLKDAGYSMLAIGADHAGWIMRNAYLNAFETEEELYSFTAGEIPFTDERIKTAYDNAAEVVKQGYIYGEEALFTMSSDEAHAAFATGKAACVATTNGSVANILESTGVENYSIITFPSFSNTASQYVLGSPDSFFVPANIKNEEAVIEVLKYLSSDEMMQMMAENSVVVANNNIKLDNPLYAEISKDMNKVPSSDVQQLSGELNDYLSFTAYPEYYYKGEEVLETLDDFLADANTAE